MMHIFNKKTAFKFNYQLDTEISKNDLLFLFDISGNYICQNNGIPTLEMIVNDKVSFKADDLVCFGEINSRKCYCLTRELLDSMRVNFTIALDEILLKTSYLQLSEAEYQAALFASHLSYWLIRHVYCGKCAAKNELSLKELALQCPNCHETTYPVISPCVIGAIYRDKEILLAKPKQATLDFYSCISGFVNPCENLESALRREVFEETSIEITNIRYIASQHWPFPNSLMVGFLAEYLSGEINIDTNELADAKWYSMDNLPKLPSNISIARHLIDICSGQR